MIRFLADNLWDEIGRLALKRSKKFAAVAYVTSEAKVRFKKSDTLIVDASDNAIRTGQTSAPLLEKAFKAGAELYNNPTLHSKVFVFEQTAVIGSANASEYSRNHLFEAGVITDMSSVVSAARAYIESLKRRSEKIDRDFVRRILSIEVVKRWKPLFFPRRKRKPVIRSRHHRTWLVGLEETDTYQDEEKLVKQGERIAGGRRTQKSTSIGWMRFTGASTLRKFAHEGDSVIQIWRPERAKKPTLVYRHCPILYRQDKPKWVRFYIEESPSAERQSLPWGVFKRLAKWVGISGKIGPTTVRLLTEEQSEILEARWASAKR